jgi:hypothetical protein
MVTPQRERRKQAISPDRSVLQVLNRAKFIARRSATEFSFFITE